MKLDKRKIKACEAWVEKYGLYPQRCGAPVKEFCRAMRISHETLRRWRKNVHFVDALTRAQEKFSATVEASVENALIKAARGYTRIREYWENGTCIRETEQVPPDVNAIIFVLSNLAPERWSRNPAAPSTTGGALELHITLKGPEASEQLPQGHGRPGE